MRWESTTGVRHAVRCRRHSFSRLLSWKKVRLRAGAGGESGAYHTRGSTAHPPTPSFRIPLPHLRCAVATFEMGGGDTRLLHLLLAAAAAAERPTRGSAAWRIGNEIRRSFGVRCNGRGGHENFRFVLAFRVRRLHHTDGLQSPVVLCRNTISGKGTRKR